MIDVSSKLFLCYAWEDIARLQNIQKEIEDELDAKITSGISPKDCTELNDSTSKKIEDALVFIVFISESSKRSDSVKSCVTYAQNLNKNILPIEIEKQSLFSSTPEEFKFRAKPYSFVDQNSKAMLFAQMKATLGFNVENGDGFGALVHVVTDRNARVSRYGEELGIANAGEDHKIRLKKGTHLLQFVDLEDSSLTYDVTYEVDSNDNEQFLNVPLGQLFKEKQLREEKAQREAEMKRKFDEENFQKNLQLEQKKRELELKEKEAEYERKKQQSYDSGYTRYQNVNFVSAIKICFTQKYATFRGRASRSEFWYFNLFSFIAMMLSASNDTILGLVFIVLVLPMVAVTVRRLHDVGKSGWYYLLAIIPYIGLFILLCWMCKPSDEVSNGYEDL